MAGGSENTTEEGQAVLVAIPGLVSPLSYRTGSAVPGAICSGSGSSDGISASIGSAVTVELGSRIAAGWVVKTSRLAQAQSELSGRRENSSQLQLLQSDSSDLRLKPVLSNEPAFLPDQLPLFEWMAEYYGVPIADVIENAIPARAESRQLQRYSLSSAGRELIQDKEKFAGWAKKAMLQGRILERLHNLAIPQSAAELGEISKNPAAALKRMLADGLIEVKAGRADYFAADLQSKRALVENPTAHPSGSGGINVLAGAEIPAELTAGQKGALETIRRALAGKKFSPILLYGVTGSGKTEVYLRAMVDVLAAGGSVLVIVPEIALTPQLFDRFSSRLGVPLGLLHSQVGASVRWNTWQALLDGRLSVALGARSAVFAPLRNLSLVIVDEEHESSYKQSDSLRYHARDVAVMRAKLAGCPVVLGSATPSFESLLNVQKKRYTVCEMMERATPRPVPSIEIVDLKSIKRREMPSENISPQLKQALDETLARGEQAVIMYNRRGFSSYLQCGSCNDVLSCPNCSVALTFHRNRGKLLCHYCGLNSPVIRYCPICRNPRTTRDEREQPKGADDFADSDVSTAAELQSPAESAAPTEPESKKIEKDVGYLFHRGSGTERVVDELGQLYPSARIIRMDRDTVGHKDAYREILGRMRAGEADILVGTQMIAKGHDLPGVTLVGIIDADVGLHLPDFRASEKIYQLITQAAGRAGRGSEAGRVLVQTREAGHPTIVATVTGRFKAFARYELEYRAALNYPPSGRLMRLIFSATRPGTVAQIAAQAAEAAAALIQHRLDSPNSKNPPPRVSVLGPAIAPLEKLLSRYRWHLLIKSSSASLLSGLSADLHAWSRKQQFPDGGRISIDVDPYDML